MEHSNIYLLCTSNFGEGLHFASRDKIVGPHLRLIHDAIFKRQHKKKCLTALFYYIDDRYCLAGVHIEIWKSMRNKYYAYTRKWENNKKKKNKTANVKARGTWNILRISLFKWFLHNYFWIFRSQSKLMQFMQFWSTLWALNRRFDMPHENKYTWANRYAARTSHVAIALILYALVHYR